MKILSANKILTFFLLSLFFTFNVKLNGQSLEKGNVQDEIIFEKEWTIGGFLHTRGWGIDYTNIKIKDNTKKRLWQISFQEIKGRTEKRTAGGATPNGSLKGYYYGKQNKFFTVDFLMGQQRKIAQTGRRKGVELAYNYKAGASLGLAKPYYMIMQIEGEGQIPVKYTGDNEAEFFDSPIVAGAGFGEGIEEMKLYPGGIVRTSLIMDIATQQDFVKSIEIGAQVQVFYKRVPIMVERSDYHGFELEKSHFIHPNLFIKMMFGRRE